MIRWWEGQSRLIGSRRHINGLARTTPRVRGFSFFSMDNRRAQCQAHAASEFPVGSEVLKILPAESELQYQQVRELLAEHIAWDTSQVSRLGLDGQEALDFYYASGDEALPGVYAPPEGRMLLATHSARAAGCGAFHRMTPEACEMKRMYVRPEFRRMRIGRRLK